MSGVRVHAIVLGAIGGLGLTAQLVLLRELFAVFAGNELSAGIFLSIWLVCEGLGAWFFGRLCPRIEGSETGWLLGLGVFSSVVSVLAVMAVVFAKPVLGVLPGESLNIFTLSLVTSAVVLLPASSHGGLFVVGAALFSRLERKTGVSRAYIYEGLGTVAAALLCYFLLLTRVAGLGIVAMFGGILLVVLGLWIAGPLLGRMVFLWLGTIFLALSTNRAGELERRLYQQVWPGQVVLKVRESAYGKMVSLERQRQRLVLYDGVVVMNAPVVDIGTLEQMVHIPMLMHPGPKRVLILGQGLAGMVAEVLKEPVTEVKMVQIDPVLVDEIRRTGAGLVQRELADPRFELVIADPRRYLLNSKDSFDLIILWPSAPDNLSANRLFSVEFFRLCRRRLTKQGLFVTRTPGSIENLPAEAGAILRLRVASLRRVFPAVAPVGLDFPLIVASKSGFILEPESLVFKFRRAGMDLTVLTPEYVSSLLDPFRQQVFRTRIGPETEVNHDLKPREIFFNMVREGRRSSPFFSRLYFKLSHAVERTTVPILFLVLFLGLGGTLVKGKGFARGFGVFTSGFAGAGISTLAILLYQVRFGSLYSNVALLLAGFMLGTVPGAGLARKVAPRIERGPRHAALLFLCADAILILLLCGLILLGARGGVVIFVSSLLLAGTSLGWQFGVASIERQKPGSISGGETAGVLSVLDFTGGALGGISIALILAPVSGLLTAGLVIAGLKMVSLLSQLLTMAGSKFRIQRV